MSEPRIAHTAELDADTLAAARALLADVFEGDFDDHDWEHALGGMHALVWEGAQLVGHAAVVQRRLVHRGRALRTGYVEGVGVHADHRRRGHGGALMGALEELIRRGYDLGALGATDDAARLYAARGWQVWQGRLSAITPSGIRPTPDEQGAVHVLPATAALDLRAELTCDWRDGDVW